MKSNIRYFFAGAQQLVIGATLATLSIAACSPEEFEGAKESEIPTMEGYSISVDTDQETNTATFTANGSLIGCHALWYLDGNPYSVLSSASYHSMEAGTHSLELKIMNRNGVSRNSVSGSFTFNETKVDYTPYFNRLTGKEWRIDYAEAGHMGCGDTGTDGSGWWSANVNDKADWGVYDDRISFAHSDADGASGGTYTYNPGEGGTVYVNTGITESPFGAYNTGDGVDYMVPVDVQNSTFNLIPGSYNGEECLYIQFAPHALLPYIPNIETYNNPYYRIESLTNSKLAIVTDNGSITWRLVFTSKEDTGLVEEEGPTAVMDWTYDSPTNLWKAVEEGSAFVGITPWFANDGWSQIADPAWTHEGNVWELDIPEGTGGSQWQGQFPIATTLSASGSKAYNFYCTIDADNDCPGVTIKLTDSSDPNNYFCTDRHEVKGGKQFVYKAESVKLAVGDAAALSLFFDFGGTPSGTHVKISNIYFEEAVSYSDPNNLWAAVDANQSFTMSFWWADANWTPVGDPTFAVSDNEDGSKIYTITSGVTNSIEWQAQNAFNTTGLSIGGSDVMNFSCVLSCNEDARATVKLCQSDDDDNALFYDGGIQLTGGKPKTVKFSGVQLSKGTDAPTVKLIFDFGGTMEGNVYTITDITLVKVQ